MPASLLATLLPAPSFLDEINKSLQEQAQEQDQEPSLQEQEQSLQEQEQDDGLIKHANGLLQIFEKEMRCQMCDICGLTFVGNNKLKEHMTERHTEHCQSPTTKPAFSVLDSNVESSSELSQPSLGDYLVNMRDMISQQSVMIAKLLAFHESPDNNCKKCSSRTEHTNNLVHHNKTQHVDNMIQCPMCNFKNKSETVVSKHIVDHHPEKYRCQKCSNEFTTRNNLNSHMKSSHTINKETPAEIIEIDDTEKEPEMNLIRSDRISIH